MGPGGHDGDDVGANLSFVDVDVRGAYQCANGFFPTATILITCDTQIWSIFQNINFTL